VCGYRYIIIIVIIIINTFAAASAEISRAKNRPGGVSFYGRGDGCGIAGRSRLYAYIVCVCVCVATEMSTDRRPTIMSNFSVSTRAQQWGPRLIYLYRIPIYTNIPIYIYIQSIPIYTRGIVTHKVYMTRIYTLCV